MNTDKETYIHAKCLKSDKAAWISAAKNKKMKLTEWINQTLNQSIEHKSNK